MLAGDFSDMKKFTFEGRLVQAKVTDVYDGDTVTIVFFNGQEPVKYSFRMLGYDAPEVKPKKVTENYELHKRAGAVVREKLRQKIEEEG